MTRKDLKVALIAGGAGAVGEGIVEAFLQAGANVIVPSRSPKNLSRLKDRFREFENSLTLIEEDLGTEEGSAKVRDKILQKFGRIDAVVASLGGWWQGLPLVNLALETWNEVLANNLTSHFVVAKSFLPVMIHQNRGSYTFIAGQGGVVPVPQSAPVSVAVAGEIMLARALDAENKKSDVRINALVLGMVNTRERRAYAQPGWITASEVGDFAAALAADLNSKVKGAIINLPDKNIYSKELGKLSRQGDLPVRS